MKKIFNKKFMIVLVLFLVPMFLLTACSQVNYYNIEVLKSSSRGEVHGPNKTTQIAENSEVTLTATENGGQFICWVKNSSQVISLDSSYKFAMSADTAGTYTGVFSESSPMQMMYTALTGIKINFAEVTNLNVNVNITPSSAITESISVYNGSASNENAFIYNGRVFSFLNEDIYLVDVSVEYEILGYEEKLTETFPTVQLKRSEFTTSKAVVSGNKGQASFELTFEKLSRELVERQN